MKKVKSLVVSILGLILFIFTPCGWTQNSSSTILEEMERHFHQIYGSQEPISIDADRIRFSSSVDLLPFHALLLKDPLRSIDPVCLLTQHLALNPSHIPGHIVNLSIFLNQRTGQAPEIHSITHVPSLREFIDMLKGIQVLTNQEVTPAMQAVWEVNYHRAPDGYKKILYHFLSTFITAWPWLEEGRNSINKIADLHLMDQIILGKSPYSDPQNTKILEALSRRIDLPSLFLGAAAFTEYCQSVYSSLNSLREAPPTGPVCFPTAFGSIVLAGKQDDVHSFTHPPLLLIDSGGNDRYFTSYSMASVDQPVSITLDLGGEDRYASLGASIGPCSARFGYAALFDYGEGKDVFEGKSHCFSYAFGGVSVLYNHAGASTYHIDDYGLGTAEYGMALLIDADGDDRYRSIFQAQGCGSVGGIGLLLDAKGNDEYIAETTPVIEPSPQLPSQNFSGSQGFGIGRFGSFQDGHPLTGGLGLFIDVEGDDRYHSSVFAMGSGYGFGIGIFSDLAGDDSYTTSWYGLGSAAHQACGFFFDREGDDNYTATHYMVGGAGVDISLGVFRDAAGNDTYQAENTAFGYGIDNSVGLFMDEIGDDRYHLYGNLGFGSVRNDRAQTLRGLWPTFGLFVDGAGDDEYSNQLWNNRDRWYSETTPHHLYGLGLDLPLKGEEIENE